MKRPQSDSKPRGGRPFRGALIAAIAMAVNVGIAPAGQAVKPEISREIRHAFSTVHHEDPIPECGFPGATEYATGNDHLVIVDQGDSFHVTFGETYRILVVFDDPTWPNEERKGTDALHFNLTKGGTETFSEAFHDFASLDDSKNFFKFDYYRTFVSTGDDIRVDREFIRKDFPPC
jgi:hypothetical protein